MIYLINQEVRNQIIAAVIVGVLGFIGTTWIVPIFSSKPITVQSSDAIPNAIPSQDKLSLNSPLKEQPSSHEQITGQPSTQNITQSKVNEFQEYPV
ncbi:hypothetical protein, partial [Heliomicrobium undosum]|uniref:hypothetical protein n=1 Tax=Heliomicrobium undosum TaxID=121734 RepID=UPI001A9AD252